MEAENAAFQAETVTLQAAANARACRAVSQMGQARVDRFTLEEQLSNKLQKVEADIQAVQISNAQKL